jgi:predicted nuclease of predicted toxin-antitoxin system
VAEPIRYYFDEHMPNAAATGLRTRGIDVLTAAECGRLTLPDDDHLRFATAERRVVVTHDEDFLTLAADFLTRGEPFGGIAFCLPTRYQGNVGRLLRALVVLHGRLTADDMLNHVEYL